MPVETPVSTVRIAGAVRTRALFAGGAVLTSSLVYLGAIWPSAYTLVAIPVVPAPFLFLYATFRPPFAFSRPRLMRYLCVASALSVLTWLFEVWWLYRLHDRA
jgi:hypothetical protein